MSFDYMNKIRKKGASANPFFKTMGIDIQGYGEGYGTLFMEVGDHMLNGGGWLQGGIYVSLADEAMALAISTMLEEGERIATITETTRFFRGVNAGTLFAEGRILKKGRRTIFAKGIVRKDAIDGYICAESDAVFSLMR